MPTYIIIMKIPKTTRMVEATEGLLSCSVGIIVSFKSYKTLTFLGDESSPAALTKDRHLQNSHRRRSAICRFRVDESPPSGDLTSNSPQN